MKKIILNIGCRNHKIAQDHFRYYNSIRTLCKSINRDDFSLDTCLDVDIIIIIYHLLYIYIFANGFIFARFSVNSSRVRRVLYIIMPLMFAVANIRKGLRQKHFYFMHVSQCVSAPGSPAGRLL